MRRVLRLGLAVALFAGVAMAAPQDAGAVGPYGGGEVSGLVSLSPGILVTSNSNVGGCDAQAYTFSSVILNGTITDGASAFAGSIGTSNVKGVSTRPGGECSDIGIGTVNSSSDKASFLSGAGGPNPVGGQFFGSYERHGPHVLVDLTGSMNFGGGASYSNVPIRLDASEFIPLVIDPATGRITQAVFSGEFHVGVDA